MALADGLVVALDATGDGAETSATLRALLLAKLAGKPVAVLRAGSPDTVRALPAMLQGAPNAAWPGEPRAAAALARALIDQASGAPP
jgi:dihydroorotase-like cyclic amidohydrolase